MELTLETKPATPYDLDGQEKLCTENGVCIILFDVIFASGKIWITKPKSVLKLTIKASRCKFLKKEMFLMCVFQTVWKCVPSSLRSLPLRTYHLSFQLLLWHLRDFLFCFSLPDVLQTQSDKEKLLYELDDLQAQVEKAQMSTNRFQAEREDFQLEAERQRDKNDKLQVRHPSHKSGPQQLYKLQHNFLTFTYSFQVLLVLVLTSPCIWHIQCGAELIFILFVDFKLSLFSPLCDWAIDFEWNFETFFDPFWLSLEIESICYHFLTVVPKPNYAIDVLL